MCVLDEIVIRARFDDSAGVRGVPEAVSGA